jgi:type I restriction enzyme S subunit
MSKLSLKPGWKIVKFGDVVKNANLVERDPEAAGIERIVGLEHLDPENLHIRRWNTPENGTSFSRKFVPGQTLFGKRRAYQRKVAFAEFEGICSGDILTFETKDKKDLLSELLPFICQSDAFFDHALGTSAGSLSPRTSWKALKDFEFPLPPIDKQKRIAEILWAADSLREKRQNTVLSLIDVAKTTEKEIFGAFIGQAKEGKIPFVTLNDVLAEPISNGIFKKREHFGSGTLLINVTDIYSSFRVDPTKLERVETVGKETTSFSAVSGDVIFNRSSLVLEGIGKACLVSDWSEPMVFECHLMRARPDSKQIDPRYLCRYSLSSFGRRYLLSRSQTTTMTTINQGDLGKLPIPLPLLKKQQQLADKLDAIDTEIQNIKMHIKIHEKLTKKLINSFFSGVIAHV